MINKKKNEMPFRLKNNDICERESECMFEIFTICLPHWRSKVKPKNCKFLYNIYTCVMYFIYIVVKAFNELC